MKKILAVLIMFFTLSFVSAVTVEPTPYGAFLSFSQPSGTVYTDIYIDNGFIARLSGSASSYSIETLRSNNQYNLAIAYRRADNSDISAEFERFRTTSWDGEYLWINQTREDNKGRVREIRLNVRTVNTENYGQYNEIYMNVDGSEYRLFPLFDLGESVSWVDFRGESPEAIVYRANAERFNKSSITPSRWLLKKMEVSPRTGLSVVETRAGIISVNCDISFEFYLGENGERMMSFLVSGPAILKSFYFSSPNGEREDGSFILHNTADF